MDLTNRDDILVRYRHLRQLNIRHQTSALRCVSTPALLAQGKRLGLASGKRFVTDDEAHLTFVYDLALYAAPKNRTRTVDRYAKSIVGEPGGDDDLLLKSMRQARFSIWRIERRHDVAGLVLRDLIRKDEWWLLDEGLEASASPRMCLALRLFQMPEAFAMSCGTFVQLNQEMVELVFEQIDYLIKKLGAESTEDRRFAESLYKIALFEWELGNMIWDAA